MIVAGSTVLAGGNGTRPPPTVFGPPVHTFMHDPEWRIGAERPDSVWPALRGHRGEPASSGNRAVDVRLPVHGEAHLVYVAFSCHLVGCGTPHPRSDAGVAFIAVMQPSYPAAGIVAHAPQTDNVEIRTIQLRLAERRTTEGLHQIHFAADRPALVGSVAPDRGPHSRHRIDLGDYRKGPVRRGKLLEAGTHPGPEGVIPIRFSERGDPGGQVPARPGCDRVRTCTRLLEGGAVECLHLEDQRIAASDPGARLHAHHRWITGVDLAAAGWIIPVFGNRPLAGSGSEPGAV